MDRYLDRMNVHYYKKMFTSQSMTRDVIAHNSFKGRRKKNITGRRKKRVAHGERNNGLST